MHGHCCHAQEQLLITISVGLNHNNNKYNNSVIIYLDKILKYMNTFILYTNVKTYSKKSSPGPSLQPAHLASRALAFARTRVMLRFPYSRVIAWDLEQHS